jgi:hypothetical protein
VQGEVDVILDLIGFVETAQHLGIANIPPRNNTLEALIQQHALKVQRKAAQLQVCPSRFDSCADPQKEVSVFCFW